jgi:hypothetical protein
MFRFAGLVFVVNLLAPILWAVPEVKSPSLGVIGDSISTGSFTAHELVWDTLELEKLLQAGPIKPDSKNYSTEFAKLVENPETMEAFPRPSRIWETLAEHKNLSDSEKLSLTLLLPLKNRYVRGFIDINEYAWPYLLGRALKISAEQIFIAAEFGNY